MVKYKGYTIEKVSDGFTVEIGFDSTDDAKWFIDHCIRHRLIVAPNSKKEGTPAKRRRTTKTK